MSGNFLESDFLADFKNYISSLTFGKFLMMDFEDILNENVKPLATVNHLVLIDKKTVINVSLAILFLMLVSYVGRKAIS